MSPLTEPMTHTGPVLVMAGTGKTGRRVVRRLDDLDVPVRAAARSGTSTRFDWHDPSTYPGALEGVSGVYLVPPANSVDFAGPVAGFLDVAESAGVEHVTYLSARGVEHAPAELALRAVELDLEARTTFSHTFLRPAWYMENFSESFLLPGIVAQGQVIAPAGTGAEAFVSVEDVSAVAVASLTEPGRHAGAAYTLTGPAPVSFAEAAEVISKEIGRPVSYVDIDRAEWIEVSVGAGVPADYATMLAGLFDVIRSGAGRSTTATVAEVLGREPVSFSAFVGLNRSAWTGQLAGVHT